MPSDPFADNSWKQPLVFLLSSLAAGGILHGFFLHIASRKMEKWTDVTGKHPLNRIRWPTLFLSMELVMLVIHPALPFSGRTETVLLRVAVLLTILTVAWTLIALVRITGDILSSRYPSSSTDDLESRKTRTRIVLVERLLIIAIVILSASSALMTVPRIRSFGESLLASAGLAGLVIGLAARPLLTNVIAGVQIALTQPIRIDDVVIAENEWGWIEEIGIAYVVVRIWDLRRLVLPLSYFIEKPFQNWTYKSAALLGYVHIYADYTVSIRDLRDQLKVVLDSTPLWDGHVWNLQVTSLDEKAVQMRALFSARDSGSRWDLSVYVREGLLGYLQRRGGGELPRVRIEMGPRPGP
ncbi:MAG: mechanosensitive ion channel family protein [Nitrospirae bacterium]|nr:mechanosensitive ion channel family protein [Nitrospirota bacterium]